MTRVVQTGARFFRPYVESREAGTGWPYRTAFGANGADLTVAVTRFSGGLLDSVILIDLLNGVEPAFAYLADREGSLYISAITRAEVLAGLDSAQFAKVRAFLDRFPLHAIDAQVADEAARLKRVHRWKLPDALQAACALLHKHTLVTRNTKDFDPKKLPWIEVPYSV